VVNDKSFKPGTEAMPETISGRSLRMSGSPPVNFTREMPRLMAILAMRTISSTVIFSAERFARFTSPSLWQYTQRLLHRWVIDILKLSRGLPQLSVKLIRYSRACLTM
jgi:hypothetical protein